MYSLSPLSVAAAPSSVTSAASLCWGSVSVGSVVPQPASRPMAKIDARRSAISFFIFSFPFLFICFY